MENCKLLLFDLDGTLLRSDKTISQTTLKALREWRKKGILIGVSTSRGEQNAFRSYCMSVTAYAFRMDIGINLLGKAQQKKEQFWKYVLCAE